MTRTINKEECETAARSLGFSDTSAFDLTKYGTIYNRPSGCIFDNGFSPSLFWYGVTNDVTCGSRDDESSLKVYFDCLCKIGKI